MNTPPVTLLKSEPSGGSMVSGDVAELDDVLRMPGWVWIDAFDPTLGTLDAVAASIGLEDVDVEDLHHLTEFPKLEERPTYLFLIAHTTSLDEERLRTVEVDLVLGPNYLLTVRREETPGFAAIQEVVRQTGISGPDELMAQILELFARRLIPLMAGVDEMIYTLEDKALVGDPEVPQQVQALRRDAILLRRVVAPQRDAQKMLAMNRTIVQSDGARNRFMSGYDDAARIAESLETARSLLGVVLDTYRATVAERMNEVMKVLTVFSAIVLPLGLIAGIYGMNFVDMPGLTNPRGFDLLVAAMAIIAVGLWAYFIKRRFVGRVRIPRVDRALGRGMAGFVHLSLAPVRLIETLLVEHEPSDD